MRHHALLRAALLMATLLLAQVARCGEHAARSPAHDAWLQRAEQRLSAGDADGAVDALDQAAAMAHDPDTEMALVRAYMAQGRYRQALAFAAHTAGGHQDAPAATALYAWLLCLGDQCAYGRQRLAEALGRRPDDAVLRQASSLLPSRASLASADLLAAPHRMAPNLVRMGGDDPVDPHAAVLATGVLLPDGAHALLPASAVKDARRLWLRDARGRTRVAQVERDADALGLVLATLDTALGATSTRVAPRDAFAGSPAFAVAFAPSTGNAPAWPWLYAGFAGRGDGSNTTSPLGIEIPSAADGAPVFDAAGRLVGVALHDGTGKQRMVPVHSLLARMDGMSLPTDDAATRLRPDEIYERGMRSAVQVLVLR